MTSITSHRITAIAAVTAVALVSCGSDDGGGAVGPSATSAVTTVEVTTTTTAAPPTTIPLVPGGWIGGEPDWEGDAGVAGGAVDMAMEEDAGDVMSAEVAADAPAIEPAPEPEPLPPIEPPVEPPVGDNGEPLRAGSVDDNADYAGFVEYVNRVAGLGIAGRPFDASGRIVVTVADEDARPVPGAVIQADAAGAAVAELRTTADGTARFFPALYGVAADAPITFSVGTEGERVIAEPGSDVALDGPANSLADPVPLDVLFLLDATGSMGDEIDRLKTTIDTVAERVSGLDPRPDIRFAMTLYRDEGDLFVTSTYDFTNDVDAFREALASVVAQGGGDIPEALDEGLAAALGEPQWRDPSEAVQLVFVVADAPPQVDRQVETPYTDSVVEAIERGIKVFPVASSESDDQAELVFRQLAVTTGAPFVFLSYGAGGAATGESTDITSIDYEELALDELVVRLIAEELADLAGPDAPPPTVPTTTPPTTTIPDEQQQPTTTAPSDEITVETVVRDVEYYGACGNETLELDGTTWYPLLDAERELDIDRYPIIADDLEEPTEAEGLLRVAPPGPGDDVGTLVVYSDGIARFESASAEIIRWMTTDPVEYLFAC